MEKSSIYALKALNEQCRWSDDVRDGIDILWTRVIAAGDDRRKKNGKMHRHTFYELHLVLNGSIGYLSGTGEAYTVRQGEYLLIPPDAVHLPAEESSTFQKLSVTFTCTEEPARRILFPNEMFRGNAGGWLPAVLDMLTCAAGRTNGSGARIYQNAIASLLFLVCERVMAEPDSSTGENDARFITAKRFIEENSSRDISVAEVADLVYLSTKQLGRLFLRYEKMSVGHFIEICRCLKAKELLEQRDIPIAEIAEILCFSSPYNFLRYFKRVEGVTPSAYRKNRNG